jgi:hypothetical protein
MGIQCRGRIRPRLEFSIQLSRYFQASGRFEALPGDQFLTADLDHEEERNLAPYNSPVVGASPDQAVPYGESVAPRAQTMPNHLLPFLADPRVPFDNN